MHNQTQVVANAQPAIVLNRKFLDLFDQLRDLSSKSICFLKKTVRRISRPGPISIQPVISPEEVMRNVKVESGHEMSNLSDDDKCQNVTKKYPDRSN